MKFLEPISCQKACKKVYTGGEDASEKKLQFLKKGIALNYQHHWIIGKYHYHEKFIIINNIILLLTSIFLFNR